MLPVPSREARLLFATAVSFLALGFVFSSAAAVTLASVTLLTLATLAAWTVPLGRRVRRQRLEFAWWLDRATGGSSGTIVPGAPFQVRCYVRHRGADALALTDVRPLAADGVELLPVPASDLLVSPSSRTEFTCRLSAKAVGRVVLHGLAVSLRGPLGLFSMPLYFPNPLVVRVLPRAAALARRSHPRTGYAASRAGRTALRRRGGGTDFHELRQLQPGDSFKSIAWKASARSGRLLIKEVEQEVQEAHVVVLDVSGTMRGGEPGTRKLDHAIDACAALALRALRDGDRVGLVLADERPIAHVPVGEGATQLPKLYDAMLAATEVVDADLTALDDDQVGALVARYIRHQDGLDFSPGKSGRYRSLVRHVHASLDREAFDQNVHADTPEARTLRAFCRSRGLHIPHRPDPDYGRKGAALAEALQLAASRERAPRSITLITDYHGVVNTDALRRTVQLLHAHGHALTVLLVTTPVDTPLEAAVYGRMEARHIREARTFFGHLGVRTQVARGSEAVAALAQPHTSGRLAS
ncbi:MAG: DUF58 domain-containing protein [Myxococcales bacterium]|nr:DUF58 domain-containing protein [Myxococcales bacterium]MCB9626874.1 DUF58 domain-containing protein [Sandaracinaceae bacterium]